MVKFIPYLILGGLCCGLGFFAGQFGGKVHGRNDFRKELESDTHTLILERSGVSNLLARINNQLTSNPTNPVSLEFDFKYYYADSELRYRFDLKQQPNL